MKKTNGKTGLPFPCSENVASSEPGNVLLKELSRDKVKTPDRFFVGSAGNEIRKRQSEI